MRSSNGLEIRLFDPMEVFSISNSDLKVLCEILLADQNADIRDLTRHVEKAKAGAEPEDQVGEYPIGRVLMTSSRVAITMLLFIIVIDYI